MRNIGQVELEDEATREVDDKLVHFTLSLLARQGGLGAGGGTPPGKGRTRQSIEKLFFSVAREAKDTKRGQKSKKSENASLQRPADVVSERLVFF